MSMNGKNMLNSLLVLGCVVAVAIPQAHAAGENKAVAPMFLKDIKAAGTESGGKQGLDTMDRKQIIRPSALRYSNKSGKAGVIGQSMNTRLRNSKASVVGPTMNTRLRNSKASVVGPTMNTRLRNSKAGVVGPTMNAQLKQGNSTNIVAPMFLNAVQPNTIHRPVKSPSLNK